MHLLKFAVSEGSNVSLKSLYQVFNAIILKSEYTKDNLKILIRILVDIWTADHEEETLKELLKIMEMWPTTKPGEIDQNEDEWFSKVGWNLALQTNNLEVKQSLYELAAGSLHMLDPARLCCRTMQLAVMVNLAMSKNLECTQDEITEMKKVIEECEGFCGEEEKSDSRTLRLLFIYKIITNLASNSNDNLMSVIEEAIDPKNEDPLVPLVMAAVLSKSGKKQHFRLPLLKGALKIAKSTDLVPTCSDLLDELLAKANFFKPNDETVHEIGFLVNWLASILQSSETESVQDEALLVVIKIWNSAVDLELQTQGQQRNSRVTRLQEYATELAKSLPKHKAYLNEKLRL